MYLQTNRVFLCFDECFLSLDERDLLLSFGDKSRPERVFEDWRRRE